MKNILLILTLFVAPLLLSCENNTSGDNRFFLEVSFCVDAETYVENEPVSFFNQVNGSNIADEEEGFSEQVVGNGSFFSKLNSEQDLTDNEADFADTKEEPYRFTWTFGDGTPQSFEKNPTHIFKTARTYTVRLRVETAEGAIASYVRQIIVRKYDETIDRQRVKSEWNAPSLIREIAPGVIFKRLIFSRNAGNSIFNSNQYVNIMEVDLSANSNLKFAIAFPGNGKTSLTTTEATNRNALAAVNGTMGSWVSASQAEFLRGTTFAGNIPLPPWSESIVAGNNSLDYIRGYNTAGTELRFEVPNFAGATFSGGKVNRADRRTGVLKINT